MYTDLRRGFLSCRVANIISSWSLIECGITCVSFIKFVFFSNNNVNNGLGELSYFLGLFITCVRLKESQKSCSTFASFASRQSMLQLTSARIKTGIFNDIAELSEKSKSFSKQDRGTSSVL